MTSKDLNAWDICAGGLLVTEAGGRLTDMRDGVNSIAMRDVLATCGAGSVHEELVAAVRAARAESSVDTYL